MRAGVAAVLPLVRAVPSAALTTSALSAARPAWYVGSAPNWPSVAWSAQRSCRASLRTLRCFVPLLQAVWRNAHSDRD